MSLELWDEINGIVIPALRFGVITPGTDKVKLCSIKNISTKIAYNVRVGAIITSDQPEGGQMLFDNQWISIRKYGDITWTILGSDLINGSLFIGNIEPDEIAEVEFKISLPPPQIIESIDKCKGGTISVYDIDFPNEFILKLVMTQV